MSKNAKFKKVKSEEDDDDTYYGEMAKGSSRDRWGNKVDFLLSCMGYAVGLSNVWRFPYLCYDSGGGAFLIPYLVMVALAGAPLLYLEVAFGQFASLGCISVWKISPLFKGLGYGMALISTFFCQYYIVIIGYTIFYLTQTMTKELPWVGCDHSWNTANCFQKTSAQNGSVAMETETIVVTVGPNVTENVVTFFQNVTTNGSEDRLVRATEEYWTYHVLGLSPGMHDMGKIRWQLLLCLLCAWVLVFFCIFKGVRSSGKVVYFTATFPYIVLTVLLIRGVTLPGSANGILYYIKPDFNKLLEGKVWRAAANQVFFSYGAAWGAMHTLASYNPFNNNCYRDALVIVASCAGTSIVAGFVVFSIIGFMAHDANIPIEEVATSGMGLAFVVYPEALARLPLPQLWSFLFFFMLLTLGIDSEFVTLETVITAVTDEVEYYIPGTRSKKMWITLSVCIILCISGLPLVMEGGIYIMTLFDWYSAAFTPMIIGITEVLVISYIYGYKRFSIDIASMIGSKPGIYWIACWVAVTPLIIVFILIFSLVDYTPAYYGDYIFPPWAEAIGWILTLSTIVLIITYAVVYLCLQEGTLVQRIQQSVRPRRDWGPALNINRQKANYRLLSVNLGGPVPFDDLPTNEVRKQNKGSLRGSLKKKMGSPV
ncbi:sodium-dependent proline transporter-like [Amphiura filiformis]|uniref:sodium-dependent proline transporter-like n=1 Tax=Amphiura filiformis TaxID=82378 RepID=UPI003B220C68